MKDTLRPGLEGTHAVRVTEALTVPRLHPDAPEFKPMPPVLATAHLVGIVEWACMKLVLPHLDWPAEQTLGVDVRLDHTAPTPPGLTVTVKARLDRVDGRRLGFSVSVHDGVEEVSRGTHERHVVDGARFAAKAARKAKP
jgi:fluoroacetyl-CoA thioesterase